MSGLVLFAQAEMPPAAIVAAQRPNLRAYRGRTLRLLRRFFHVSVEIGRLPSLIGREIFRGRVTRCRVPTFEDRVIFAHDMEQCLARLEWFSQQLIARVVFQEHSFEEAARLLRTTERTVRRRFPAALDALAEMLLRNGLMRADPCQEGESGPFSANDSNDEK
jgi:hypothetical protein